MAQDCIQNRYAPQIDTLLKILGQYEPQKVKPQKILVLGCGEGYEAAYLHEATGAQVYGIDIDQEFDAESAFKANLQNYSGGVLPYAADFFDLIYSFHVLEHVENPDLFLSEAKRVLMPDGVIYIGVPNKKRLFGYLGMKDKSFKSKFLQNMRDWSARLRGRFENRYGAHAGFSEQELIDLMGRFFNHLTNVTELYYAFKWPGKQKILNILCNSSLYKLIFPSVYVIAKK